MEYILEPTVRQKMRKMLRIRSAAVTQQGKSRRENQDAVFHWSGQTEMGQNIGLYIVCDGLSGHQAGGIASRLAVEMVTADLIPALKSAGSLAMADPAGPTSDEMGEWIEAAIAKANAKIFRDARYHRSASNMGTTITLAMIYDQRVEIANVGDNRTYHWRVPQLTQITHDHSYVAALVARGLIRESEAATHPKGNLILRALGIDERVKVDLFSREVEPGEKLLLCSDGLWRAFPEPAELGRWFFAPISPAELCQQLSTESYRRGGTDDSSAVVVTVS